MMISATRIGLGIQELSESRESLLPNRGARDGSSTDVSRPPSFVSDDSLTPPPSHKSGCPAYQAPAMDLGLKKRSPSYLRRFFGVRNFPSPPPPYPYEDLWKIPMADLIANTEGQVKRYFNVNWGCKPDEYRPGMSPRVYFGFEITGGRSGCLYSFPEIAEAEPAIALRIMRQTLAPPVESELDARSIRVETELAILPSLRKLAAGSIELSDQAIRDLIEGLGSMEKHFANDFSMRKEIQDVKAAFFG